MSTLVTELQLGVVGLLDTLTSNTNSVAFDIPYAFDHTEAQAYPIIIYRIVDCITNTLIMNGPTNIPTKVCVARTQISVFANEDQQAQASGIMEAVDSVFAFGNMQSNTVNMMAIYPMNETISFFDSDQKIWHYTRDYKVFIGD